MADFEGDRTVWYWEKSQKSFSQLTLWIGRPIALDMGGGERRAPLPVAGENHVIRWFALSGTVAPIPSRSPPRSANHRITWFSLASGGGARRPPPPIQLVWGRTFFFVILVRPKIPKCFVVVSLTTKTQNTVRFLPLWNSLCAKSGFRFTVDLFVDL